MQSDENVLKIQIYGSEYTIRGKTDMKRMKSVAEYLDLQMQEVGNAVKVDSSLKVAILASLNITYEFFQVREEKEQLKAQLDQKIEELNALIDKQFTID